MTLPWRALIHFAIAAAATIAFVVLAGLVLHGRADAIDREWALAIHGLATTTLDYVMLSLTLIGGYQIRWVATLVTMAWLLRSHHHRMPLILAVNAIAAQLLEVLFKHLIARPRPTLWSDIAVPDSFSFPSGHALSSMAVYGGIAAVLVALSPWSKPVVVAVAVVLVLGIGYSRVYLGVHWPFDVLAGFAAGVPFVVATVHLLRTRSDPKTVRLSA